MVIEVLSGLFQRDVDLGLLFDFKVGTSSLVVSHLYFPKNMLILGEVTLDNISVIKYILWVFEVALGLQVNFVKISLAEVNVDFDFLVLAGGFLYCKLDTHLFKYLSLMIGFNPRQVVN